MPAHLIVERCGPMVTVQDRGRRGQARYGVPASGPLDREVFDAAVAAVGGAVLEAVGGGDLGAIEIPLASARFRVEGTALVSIDGEPPQEVTDTVVEVPVHARAVRYLAVRGGIDVPRVLGSRATLPIAGLGGFHGRPLRAGDRLAIGEAGERAAAAEAPPRGGELAAGSETLLTLLPAFDVDEEVLRALLAGTFAVDPRSDRVGTRLAGAASIPAALGERLSRPIVPGTVQLPPDGRPIVIGPDGPTTGGYPVVGVLDRESRWRLARVRPGGRVRFHVAETRGRVNGA
ncbi:MAG: biotin-dependent carboxyltransferase family protein [Deltaproteobacteria bacterium]|nr:biotin-dependent carboxyltransferase family protein [Deltaproteobacteria bacterium]